MPIYIYLSLQLFIYLIGILKKILLFQTQIKLHSHQEIQLHIGYIHVYLDIIEHPNQIV